MVKDITLCLQPLDLGRIIFIGLDGLAFTGLFKHLLVISPPVHNLTRSSEVIHCVSDRLSEAFLLAALWRWGLLMLHQFRYFQSFSDSRHPEYFRLGQRDNVGAHPVKGDPTGKIPSEK